MADSKALSMIVVPIKARMLSPLWDGSSSNSVNVARIVWLSGMVLARCLRRLRELDLDDMGTIMDENEETVDERRDAALKHALAKPHKAQQTDKRVKPNETKQRDKGA
jgi:hypothetical protein